MNHEFGIYTKIHRCPLRILVAIVLLTLMAHVLGDSQKSRAPRSRGMTVTDAQKQRIAGGSISPKALVSRRFMSVSRQIRIYGGDKGPTL